MRIAVFGVACSLMLASSEARAQGFPESSEAACTDGADNDGDGHVDCDDQDCGSFAACAEAAPAPAPEPAPAAAPAFENTAAACRDGADNDGDGHVDCADQDCGLFTFCAGAAPTAPVVAPAAGSPTLVLTERPSAGWAFGAAVTGFVFAGALLLLGIPGELSNDDIGDWDDGGTPASIGIGAVQTVIFAALVPVVAAGAGSVRPRAVATGCPSCAITGWVFYGLTLSVAVVALGIGIAGGDTPPGVPIAATLVGVTSLSLFSSHALIASRQARALEDAVSTTRRPLAILPFVTPLSRDTGQSGAIAGIAMAY